MLCAEKLCLPLDLNLLLQILKHCTVIRMHHRATGQLIAEFVESA